MELPSGSRCQNKKFSGRRCRNLYTIPKGPCRYMVYAWALKGLLYHDFGYYSGTWTLWVCFGAMLFLGQLDPNKQCRLCKEHGAQA